MVNIVNMVYFTASQHDNRQEAQERQAQAEEEAGLALLTRQAGMKLTLTQKVPSCSATVPGQPGITLGFSLNWRQKA